MMWISLHDPDLVRKFADSVVEQLNQDSSTSPEVVIESEEIGNPAKIGQRLLIGRRIRVDKQFSTSRTNIEMLAFMYRALILHDYELALKGKLVLAP